ncbi:hypothetical protein ACJX0J_010356 [Zea mays]
MILDLCMSYVSTSFYVHVILLRIFFIYVITYFIKLSSLLGVIKKEKKRTLLPGSNFGIFFKSNTNCQKNMWHVVLLYRLGTKIKPDLNKHYVITGPKIPFNNKYFLLPNISHHGQKMNSAFHISEPQAASF